MFRLVLMVVLFAACGTGSNPCEEYFEPYPNIIGHRVRNVENGPLLDAMAAYDKGDFRTAAEGLRAVIDENASDNTARIYLAVALLGSGEPYKAEMHLDFLERQRGGGFKDQVDYYNALCWLCSGQNERALQQCVTISNSRAHTYKEQARDMVRALSEP